MHIKTLFLIVLLFTNFPLQAQNSEFPTLDALADVEIPGYDYVEALGRLGSYNPSFAPPASPPRYQVGDSQSFMLPYSDDHSERAENAELRGMTEHVLVWATDSANVSRYRAQTLAEMTEENVLGPMQQLFGFREPPGVDGDPRFNIVIMANADYQHWGFFARSHAIPRTHYSDSNQREMVVINLQGEDASRIDLDWFAATAAHEFQHVLLFHRDAGEELWLNEALSTFSEYYTYGERSAAGLGEHFLAAPNTALTRFRSGEDVSAKYGAAALFMIFLAEQFGNEIVARLQADSANGWRSVDKVLRENFGVSADDVFADWVLANYLQDAVRGFGYETLDPLLIAVQPVATLREFPALHSGRLPQYSSDYLAVDVRGADKLWLRLTQAPEANLINVAPDEGDRFYFAVSADYSDSRLTRHIDLLTFDEVWLEYRIWYDLAKDFEYGYVQVSADRGKTWEMLAGKHTEKRQLYNYIDSNGYTGNSGGWLQERIDLGDYASRPILLRFEVITDAVTSYRGMAIDDLRIDAIDYHDGFESPDDAWVEEGWIRTDNRLPQNTWLQVVQETPDGLRLSRTLMTSSGEIIVDLLPDAFSALVAISPVVPQTSLETQYTLEANLIDANGVLMAAARGCTVTTTHALNFRDAPNGKKIGLLPHGTVAMALNRRAGWFKVAYDGERGWISGDYVTLHGDCA